MASHSEPLMTELRDDISLDKVDRNQAVMRRIISTSPVTETVGQLARGSLIQYSPVAALNTIC
jgi:hypothetical protein